MPLTGHHTYTETRELRNEFFNDIVPMCPNLIFLLLTKRPGNVQKYIPQSWITDPPVNIMIGTSIVNQETADRDTQKLIDGYYGWKFLSVEPQLEDINFKPELLQSVEWVIQGGESGHKRRPFDVAWAYNLKQQCADAETGYFFKQIDKVIQPPADLEACKHFPAYVMMAVKYPDRHDFFVHILHKDNLSKLGLN